MNPTDRSFHPGQPWLDTSGTPIQAHSAGVFLLEGVYYWYGEDKSSNTSFNRTGVSGYRSTDLLNWEHMGVVLKTEDMPIETRGMGAAERPKVLYNQKTKQFVMWIHIEEKQQYSAASAGIAISDKPEGPFKWIRKERPIHFDYGYTDPDWVEEKLRGNTLRDMNLFVDEDSRAYVIYASENNATLYAVELNDEYTWIREPAVQGKTWERIVPNGMRKAPAMFKYRGQYYLFSSGLTGWHPNPGMVHTAQNVLGPWTLIGDPCKGFGAETNYRSQPTCVIAAPHSRPGSFIYLSDRWNWHNLRDSSYVWLPFVIGEDVSKVSLDYYESWSLDIFQKKCVPPTPIPPSCSIDGLGRVTLTWKEVSGADGYRLYQDGQYLCHTTLCEWTTGRKLPGEILRYQLASQSLTGGDSKPCEPAEAIILPRERVYLSDLPEVSFSQGYGTLERDRAVASPEMIIAGERFTTGLGTHADSGIAFDLAGRYVRFTGRAGLSESAWPTPRAQMRIVADGKELFATPHIGKTDKAVPFDVDVTGVQGLILEGVGVNEGHHGLHLLWVDTVLKMNVR